MEQNLKIKIRWKQRETHFVYVPLSIPNQLSRDVLAASARQSAWINFMIANLTSQIWY